MKYATLKRLMNFVESYVDDCGTGDAFAYACTTQLFDAFRMNVHTTNRGYSIKKVGEVVHLTDTNLGVIYPFNEEEINFLMRVFY